MLIDKHYGTFIFNQYPTVQKRIIAQCLDYFTQWLGDDPFNEPMYALESY